MFTEALAEALVCWQERLAIRPKRRARELLIIVDLPIEDREHLPAGHGTPEGLDGARVVAGEAEVMETEGPIIGGCQVGPVRPTQ